VEAGPRAAARVGSERHRARGGGSGDRRAGSGEAVLDAEQRAGAVRGSMLNIEEGGVPTRSFAHALKELEKSGEPSDRVRRFLSAHVSAPKRRITARELARAAGYRNYGGINLQYGLLAHRIRERLKEVGPKDSAHAYLSLLVEFYETRS